MCSPAPRYGMRLVDSALERTNGLAPATIEVACFDQTVMSLTLPGFITQKPPNRARLNVGKLFPFLPLFSSHNS